VLRGAVPLLANQDDPVHGTLSSDQPERAVDMPVGAKIIRAARAYDALSNSHSGKPGAACNDLLVELRKDAGPDYSEVLDALERVVQRTQPDPVGDALPEPVFC
jgi:hypothetical protein